MESHVWTPRVNDDKIQCMRGTMHMKVKHFVLVVLTLSLLGCAGTSKKIAKPVDQTAEELTKVRELKTEEGETRAILSPADEKQLKITF